MVAEGSGINTTQVLAGFVTAAQGADVVVPTRRDGMVGEDFAYYLEKVPGCFFLVGVEPADRASYPSLHSDRFDFTDAAISQPMRPPPMTNGAARPVFMVTSLGVPVAAGKYARRRTYTLGA